MRRTFVTGATGLVGRHLILNLLCRIYADEPDAHPELALDRMLFERIVKGGLM